MSTEWEKRTKEITNEEANLIVCYILMTTKYREGEAETWEELAQERNEDGTVRFKNAAANGRFWRDLEKRLNNLKEKLDT